MQIYAFDSEKRLTHVLQASRRTPYTCPECQAIVHLRSGRHRRPHFFHLTPSSCRLNGKSETHLRIQLELQNSLTPERVLLEHRFPTIGRIADLYWPAQKLIFEIQVSPITAEEILCRNRDYEKLGLTVVWILHHSHYNRTHMTRAEIALTSSPHYFTNINSSGKGTFYDQYARIQYHKRIRRTPPLAVSFKKIILVDQKQLPRHFPKERKNWRICFEGDLFHNSSLFFSLARSSLWHRLFVRPYLLFFRHLLEKTTL